ncbi:MAG: hypothetical protein CMJ64_03015 [Planctomycetaceae bacterium]|nr:hypothetical protein [Planctomycetaceae bacterium]
MTIFRISVIVFVCLSSLVINASAQAQGRGGFGGGIFGRSSLLIDIPEVRTELHVADEQKELLDALEADLSNQRRAMFSAGGQERPPQDPHGQGDWFEKLRSRLEAFDRRGEQIVSIVLEPDQTNRLTELRLQREGARAFRRSDVLDKLEVSEEQRKEIADVLKANATPRLEPVFNFDQMREQLAKQQVAVLAILTDEQKTSWEELKGAPFQFPRRGRFGRRPRGH